MRGEKERVNETLLFISDLSITRPVKILLDVMKLYYSVYMYLIFRQSSDVIQRVQNDVIINKESIIYNNFWS